MTYKINKFYELYSGLYSKLSLKHFKHLDNSNVSVSQMEYLNIIEKTAPIMLTDLASVLEITKASTTAMVKKLELKGFVKKTPSLMDKRSAFITLTDKGLELLDIDKKDFQEIGKMIIDKLTAEEAVQLFTILEKVLFREG